MQKLQCGHGLIAVENATAPGVTAPESALQCGHGLIAVENGGNSARRVCVIALQCGHGLIAVENNSIPPDIYETVVLQCGHGLIAVENVTTIWTCYGTCATSMRPRPDRRGERVVSAPTRHPLSYFNAATA